MVSQESIREGLEAEKQQAGFAANRLSERQRYYIVIT